MEQKLRFGLELGWICAGWQHWKKIWADYEQVLRAFFMYSGAKHIFNCFENIVASALKVALNEGEKNVNFLLEI
jgi:hypothetical protein